MKENIIYFTSFSFLFLALVSTICYYITLENSFSFQLTFLVLAMIFSFISIILLTILFVKHQSPWSQVEYMNTIISYVISFFVIILCAILLNQLILLEQSVWYTLPTMLLYESGSELYTNPSILVNDIQPLDKSFEEYQTLILQEKNGNVDMITRLVLLNFTNTVKIQLVLPKELFEKSFNIDIVSLDGTNLSSITNENKDYSYNLYGPKSKSNEGISVSSLVAYFYLNIRLHPFSETNYKEIQNITKNIRFVPDNPLVKEDIVFKKLYPNLLANPNFHIRDRSNFPSLEYFQGFSNMKALQVQNAPKFWSKFSDIGIHDGNFETTFYYRLAPLLNSIQKRLQKTNIENQQRRGWFSFTDALTDGKETSLKTEIDKTILYWFYKYPLANNTFVFITSTDSDGNKLNGSSGNYTFSFENPNIQFSSRGFWSLSVYNSSSRKLSSLKSHYSSSDYQSIELGTKNGDIIIPKTAFYVIFKLVNVFTKNINSKDISLIYKS